MLVEIRGYNRLKAKLTRPQLQHLQQDFLSLVSHSVTPLNGIIVKNIGFAQLITFSNGMEVMQAGLRLEAAIAKEDKALKPWVADIKIVIDTDEETASWPSSDTFRPVFNLVSQIDKFVNGKPPAVPVKKIPRISRRLPEAAAAPLASAEIAAEPPKKSFTQMMRDMQLSTIGKLHWRQIALAGLFLALCLGVLDWESFRDQSPFTISVTTNETPVPTPVSLKNAAPPEHRPIPASLQSLRERAGVPEPIPSPEEEPAPVQESHVSASAMPESNPAADFVTDSAVEEPAYIVPKLASIHEQMRFANDTPPSEERIARYNAVLEYYPESMKAMWAESYIGETLIELNRHAEAKQVLLSLMERIPPKETSLTAQTLFLLGLCYLNEKDYEQAELAFETVISDYPSASFQVLRSKSALYAMKR